MIKVLLATVTPTQIVNANFAHNLSLVCKFCLQQGIDINPIFITAEHNLIAAKNQIFKIAYEKTYDYTVLLDSNIDWHYQTILNTKNYQQDVTQLTRAPGEIYTNSINGIVISQQVINDLWESNCPINYGDSACKNIFETWIIQDQHIDEDVVVLQKIRELGFKIHTDTNPSIDVHEQS